MQRRKNVSGFTLIEVIVAVAIFVLFSVGIYGAISFVFKIVYQSRLTTLETALLSEELDVVRNVSYADVGIVGGVPAGLIPYTKAITRNGISFSITATVRNIDDPFDGTLGGNPNDSAPADYKLVELSVICNQCFQRTPVALSTVVGPKNLEGSSKNGALFIHVFDAQGLSVPGAAVHIVDNATNPATTIDDVTDNEGYLRVIDAPTGTLSYAINVSKNGYSSDFTVSSTQQNPNPVRPPANIVSQTVTEVSFAIDRVGSINLTTLNTVCSAVANTSVAIQGAKYIGTDPLVYKYNQTVVTDGSGGKALANMEWDTYTFSTMGTARDIVGAIPQLPVKLDPGVAQNVTLVVMPHVANSLLATIKDAGTGLPLAGATVQPVGTGYDQTYTTDLGFTRQTDWSGGSGQATAIDLEKYWSDDGGLALSSPAGDVKLRKVGNNYVASGWLESSTFDVGQAVDFKNIVIEPLSQPSQTGSNSVRFQIATSNSSSPASWNFLGPDGTNTTFYTAATTTISNVHDGQRYMRYRAYLSTADNKYTPQLSEVDFTYTNACTPPGQSFFGNLNSGTYTLNVNRAGYTSSTGQIDVNDTVQTTVTLSPL